MRYIDQNVRSDDEFYQESDEPNYDSTDELNLGSGQKCSSADILEDVFYIKVGYGTTLSKPGDTLCGTKNPQQ